jgi:SAM-dependent methyltransferase
MVLKVTFHVYQEEVVANRTADQTGPNPNIPLDQRAKEILSAAPKSYSTFEVECLSKVLASIDRRRLADAKARHDIAGIFSEHPASPVRYFDIPFYLFNSLRYLRKYNLVGQTGASMHRILDIGAGGGFFCAMAQAAGHEAIASDIDTPPLNNQIYTDLCDLLGVKRIILKVEPMVPLPLNEKFSMVTSHAILFDRLNRATGELWGFKEWDFFLKDVNRILGTKAGGYLHLAFNPRESVGGYQALLDHFAALGAKTNSKARVADFVVKAPEIIASVATAKT